MEQGYEQRGYLREDFRLFHLRDRSLRPIEFHYHAFHKIIVFLAGHGSYAIEGRRFGLMPGDLLFVPQGCIHRPEIDADADYERIVLYIRPSYLRSLSGTSDLETCFHQVRESLNFAARPDIRKSELYRLLRELEAAPEDHGFGSELLTQSLFLRLMVELTRTMQQHELSYVAAGKDPRLDAVLRFLNDNLTEALSVDALAAHFHISKYHFMHRFKSATGYTVHQYLSSKRLLLARERIEAGESPTQVCFACGYNDYSAFSRAFRKQFGISPRKVQHG